MLNTIYNTNNNSVVHYTASTSVFRYTKNTITFLLKLTTHLNLQSNTPITKYPTHNYSATINPQYQNLSSLNLYITLKSDNTFTISRPEHVEMFHNRNYYPKNKQTILNNTFKNITNYVNDYKSNHYESEYQLPINCDLTNINPVNLLQIVSNSLSNHQLITNYININNKLIAKYNI